MPWFIFSCSGRYKKFAKINSRKDCLDMRLWGKTVFSAKCPCFVVTFRRSALYMLHPILASSGLYSNERSFISFAAGWIPTLSEENSLTWFKIFSGSGNSMALFFCWRRATFLLEQPFIFSCPGRLFCELWPKSCVSWGWAFLQCAPRCVFLRVFSMPCAVFSLWGRPWKLHRLTWSFIYVWQFFSRWCGNQ